MKIHTLNRKEKLKSHNEIKELFSQPQIITEFPFKVFYKIEKGNNYSLNFGVSVSKRKFKKSPDRNKIKRVIREAYRTQNQKLKLNIKFYGKISMMIIYLGDDLPKQQETATKILKILNRLNNIVIP